MRMTEMDLGNWKFAAPRDWQRSMEALNKSTSYEDYLERITQLAAEELIQEIEESLR